MTVRLNSKLYSLRAVRQCVKDYAELADMAVEKSEDGYIRVSVKTLKDEAARDQLMDEFCNYALHRTIEEKKKW